MKKIWSNCIENLYIPYFKMLQTWIAVQPQVLADEVKKNAWNTC